MNCRDTIWKLRLKLFKIKIKEVWMRYIKILIWAIIEIIAELYNKRNGKG